MNIRPDNFRLGETQNPVLADLSNSVLFSRADSAFHITPLLRRNTSACNDADSKKMGESSPFSLKGQQKSLVLYFSNNDIGRGLRLMHEGGKGFACLEMGDFSFYDKSLKRGQSVEMKALLTPAAASAHDTFSIGRLLLNMFCRKPEYRESEYCEWEQSACNAAKEGKDEILRLMKSGKEWLCSNRWLLTDLLTSSLRCWQGVKSEST